MDLIFAGVRVKCHHSPIRHKTLKETNHDTVGPKNRAILTVMDFKPFENIPDFDECRSPLNPLGFPTFTGFKGPCKPGVHAPWSRGHKTIRHNGEPILTKESHCMCEFAMGRIEIEEEDQHSVTYTE
ncbi:DUF4280 domain-containing protein [Candidatus Gromoviella agglomerans]|uniref:DUF4280 domain-containing protein n=1 Tax=Candidatus Gromoviella agglomerans TaxID=2806609 RepID=UPI001E5375D1|nr:DUF4280 domain-containing protein [Candidatus Gromoviella agglomerans]UFX98458.1 DUF4280 domain-containing protein [Candidatus Gromoviella agglomerans]